MPEYPDDADGDALQRIADDGVDMTKPLAIEFQILVPNENTADKVARELQKSGYGSNKDYDDVDDEWLIICPIEMVPSYENVVSMQKTLEGKLASCKAQLVGWGALV
ncbi:MAG: ribonuclease E inhibitor RraB [Pseudomonadota bacterium]